MKILDRYIAGQLIAMILLVALALLGVDLFFYLINELRFVGKGNYGLPEALLFVILTIPRKLYIMFPWSALLGSLLALGNLARSNELLAMRSAAISIHRISLAALKGATILVLLVIFLDEIVAPATERLAQQKKTRALSKGQTIETEQGVWIRNNNEFIHIGNMADNQLAQIEKYKFSDQLILEEVIVAEKAYRQDENWKLENIQGTKFLANQTKEFITPELIVPKLVDLSVLETAQVKHLERLSIKYLLKVIKHRAANELSTQSYKIALWTKIFQPLVILIMVYLAIPFVFGPLRQASMGLKLLTGVLVGFSFYTVNSIFIQLPTVVNLAPVLAIALPPVIFFVVGFYMLSRVR